jgi:hypothetical protein
METLEGLNMETTENIRGKELPPSLRKRFNVRSCDYLTVTIKIRDNENYDVENMWDTIIDGVKEASKDLKSGKKLPTIQEVLKTL